MGIHQHLIVKKLMLKVISSFIIILLFSFSNLSCIKEIDLTNPFDPEINLSPPQNVQIEFMNENGILFSWDEVNPYVNNNQKQLAKILFEQKIKDANNYSLIDSANAEKSTKAIYGAYIPGRTYYFQLYEKIESKVSPTVIISGKPSSFAPKNFRIISLSPTSVKLSWDDTVAIIQGYKIEMSLDGLNFDSTAFADDPDNSIEIPGAFEGNTVYYFRVCSSTSLGYSNYSNIAGQNMEGNSYSGLEMVYVQGGTFLMGSPDSAGETDEHPQHSVTLSSYYIGKYEVTQKQWWDVVEWKKQHGGTNMNPHPNTRDYGDNLPVGSVSESTVNTWISYLNEKEGTTAYRLPTEAEWEYAAMGGIKSNHYIFSGSNNICEVGWVSDVCNPFTLYSTQNVGTKQPNELNIFDMSGNALEFTCDDYQPYSDSSQTNPRVLPEYSWDADWVIRGGGAIGDGMSKVRYKIKTRSHVGESDSGAWDELGFRLVKELK